MMYDKLVEMSPYPVEIVLSGHYIGSFHWRGSACGCPHVELYDALKGANRNAVLIHEIGHAIHHKRNCVCFTKQNEDDRRFLSELHAFRFGLKFMIKHKMFDELWYDYNLINSEKHSELVYAKVFQQIKKERIWCKVKRKLGIK